jgi:AbrB family looped-hinge helix DNA binding protein
MTTAVFVTRLTAKGQTTIPSKVRRLLGLSPGDSVMFAVNGDKISLKRAEKLDAAFLRLATESFSDWDAPEAEDAFRDL